LDCVEHLTRVTICGAALLCLQVVLAEGDLNSDNLGLSAATTQQLLEQVDIVIHSAASIGRWGYDVCSWVISLSIWEVWCEVLCAATPGWWQLLEQVLFLERGVLQQGISRASAAVAGGALIASNPAGASKLFFPLLGVALSWLTLPKVLFVLDLCRPRG
jgi:hypothetical protein